MTYIHWMDLLIFLACSGALFGVLALTDWIGGRK